MLKKSLIHYEKDIIKLKYRIIEFEGLKNDIQIKIGRIEQNFKTMKQDRVRCDICNLDTHRAS